LSLLAHFAPDHARRLYKEYVKHFWLEKIILAGFAEWPRGRAGFEDRDSGPVILGIGTAASALGLATTRAMDDDYRSLRLLMQLGNFRRALERFHESNDSQSPLILGGMIRVRPEYYTGFLFGDAILFYALTWVSWEKDVIDGKIGGRDDPKNVFR